MLPGKINLNWHLALATFINGNMFMPSTPPSPMRLPSVSHVFALARHTARRFPVELAAAVIGVVANMRNIFLSDLNWLGDSERFHSGFAGLCSW
ncbi:MAG: hypothetical protein HYX66_06755 [Ignavibacteria bacterium]|nr:hypothetical protein [Ignavibacteria bacterium]